MDSNERMYSIKEVAYALGIGRDSVKRRIDRGHLKAWVMPSVSSKRKRTYRTRRISETELRRFIQSNMSA